MIPTTIPRRMYTGSLVVLVSLSCWVPEVFGQVRIRENYRDMSPAKRQKFRNALVTMKNDTTDTGGLWQCSMPAASVGKICSSNADCDTPLENGVCDMTAAALCEWTNKYDKYVCWHDKCG